MTPRVLPADDPASIALAVRLLRAGELVAFPTETVYGLGARALDPVHIARIFAAKGRPTSHPLIAHADSLAMARGLASDWGPNADVLAAAFWPGPLTLVLPRAPHVPAAVAGGGSSIAVRIPSRPCALALIRALGEPIAAPSANRYQGLSPTLAEHVVRSLGDAVALVLDGGPTDAGIESTVVDVRGDVPRLLRPGALSLDRLRSVVWVEDGAAAEDVEVSGVAAEDVERASPGLDRKHYSPRARLVLCSPGELGRAIAARLEEEPRATVGALAVGDVDVPRGTRVERLAASPEAYARDLFAALHRLDDAGVDVVVVERVPRGDGWTAIADRLKRAESK